MPTNDRHALYVPPNMAGTPPSPPSNSGVLVTLTSGDCSGGGSATAAFSLSHLDPAVVGVCAVALLVGVAFCIFGYRFMRAVLFTTGLLFGSVIIYIICDKETLFEQKWANAGVAVGGGILFGLITMLVEYVGLFLTGFASGTLIGCIAVCVIDVSASVHTIWLTIGCLFVSGLLCALVTVRWERAAIIVLTSFVGGALILCVLDYLVQQSSLLRFVWHTLNMRHPPLTSVCWHQWPMAALWPAVFVCGVLVQCRLTGRRQLNRDRRKNGMDKCDGPLIGSDTPSRAWRYQPSSTHVSRLDECSSSKASGKKRTVFRREHSPAKPYTNDTTPPPSHSPTPGGTGVPERKKSFRSLYQQRQKHGDVICQVSAFKVVAAAPHTQNMMDKLRDTTPRPPRDDSVDSRTGLTDVGGTSATMTSTGTTEITSAT